MSFRGKVLTVAVAGCLVFWGVILWGFVTRWGAN
jgi:hypothetical protein